MEEKKEKPKRRILLDTGRKLFWKYGFRRVSVDEICKVADISKMTFYRCFKNKSELAKMIFSEVIAEGLEKFNEIINADISSSEKLKRILVMKMEGTNDISRDFLMDFYNSPDTELQKFVEETTRKSWNEVITGFRYGQERGWFRKDFKPEFLFYISQKIIPMMTDEELLKFYDNPQDLILEMTNFFTYGITSHE